MTDTLEVGRYGRIILPKDIRQRHGIREKTRLIIRERGDQIILIPVATYEKPTEALYGSVDLTPPADDPKETARRHLHRKALGEHP